MTISRRAININFASIALSIVQFSKRSDAEELGSTDKRNKINRLGNLSELIKFNVFGFVPRRNILNYGSKSDGVSDDYPAFCSARDSVSEGESVTVIFPKGDYYLSATPIAASRRVICEIHDGAKFNGPFRPYGQRIVTENNGRYSTVINSSADKSFFVGDTNSVFNTGPLSGYGFKYEYFSEAKSGGGGDIARGYISKWDKLDGGAGFGRWMITVTPETTISANWSVVDAEFNIVNRGPDLGWSDRRGSQRTWAGIHCYGPDVGAFAGRQGKNILFSQAFFQSAEKNQYGKFARSYNINLVEPNAIAALGYYAYVAGSTSTDSADWPRSPIVISRQWLDGIRMDRAHIRSGAAFSVGQSQAYAYRGEDERIVAMDLCGKGDPNGQVEAPQGSTWRRIDGGFGQTFYVKESGNGTAFGWVGK